MSRSAALLLAIALVSGCKIPGSSNEPVDPFFGRTRVPPPPTGTIPRDASINPGYGPYRANPLRGTEGSPKAPPPPSPGVAWIPVWKSPQAGVTIPSPVSSQPVGPRAVDSVDGSRTPAVVVTGDQILIPLAARDLSPLLPQPTSEHLADPPRRAIDASDGKPGTVGSLVAASRRDPVIRTLNPQRPRDLGGMLPNAPVPQDIPISETDPTQTFTAARDTPATDSGGAGSSGGSRR